MKKSDKVVYDKRDKNSIYNHAKKLSNHSFRDVIDEYYADQGLYIIAEPDSLDIQKGKGSLGEIIEKFHFGYDPNNISGADFSEAKIELKVTPFKINKNKTISAKERLVISMINYHEIIKEQFYDSNLWQKIQNILLIYYKWDEDTIDILEYIIKYVYLYSPTKEDLRIIIEDYNKIKSIVNEGKAHELSESATLYLGAVTKAADSTVRTTQPNSKILAKPRAYSLKVSFMNQLLRNRIEPQYEYLDKVIKDDKEENFEDYVINKINKYSGIKDKDLFEKFFNDRNLSSKNKHSRLAYEILGVKTKNADEFVKANIEVKVVRIQKNGNVKESMSFPSFKVKDLIKEDWENSQLNNMFLETKFLFIIYQQKDRDYYLEKALFWNMPIEDLEKTVKHEWNEVINTFKKGVEFTVNQTKEKEIIQNNLPNKSKTEIIHVRPHASKAAYLINGKKYGSGEIGKDTDELPNGDFFTKHCFWLNNTYIKKIVVK